MNTPKMRAEKPCRTPASELQTEPYGTSDGQKPFWTEPSKSWYMFHEGKPCFREGKPAFHTWPVPRVGPNLAGARFCSTQAKLQGSKKSPPQPKSARPWHVQSIFDPRRIAWVDWRPKSKLGAWGREDFCWIKDLPDTSKIAWVEPIFALA